VGTPSPQDVSFVAEDPSGVHVNHLLPALEAQVEWYEKTQEVIITIEKEVQTEQGR